MGITQTNDSTFYVRRAVETSYGVLPAQIMTFGGTPATGGTFKLSHRGTVTGTIAFDAAVATVQSAVDAAWGSGVVVVSGAGALPTNPHTFTFASGPTAANPMLQAFAISADLALLTGGSPTVTFTGGPVWTVLLVDKVTPPDNKPAFLFDKEERNSKNKYYLDAATRGGAVSNWKISGGVRPDQIGHDFANIGLTDTITTVTTGVYSHAFKEGVGDGSSYTYQCYDGKGVWTSCGVLWTDLKITTTSGETGKDNMEASGWGYLADFYTGTVPTITLPSSPYFKTCPTNTGRAVTLGGGSNSYFQAGTFAYKRAAKPLFTQTGTIYPYRAEFDDRDLAPDITLVGDVGTELAAAKAGTAPRAFVLAMTSADAIATTYHPTLTINIPRYKYADYGSDTGNAAARHKLKMQPFYSVSDASQVIFTVQNETTPAY